MTKRYVQADAPFLLSDPNAVTCIKRSRIVALPMDHEFEVETDRGIMKGKPGDWLVTNHPDDDPDSDLWTISADRMRETYVPVVEDER